MCSLVVRIELSLVSDDGLASQKRMKTNPNLLSRGRGSPDSFPSTESSYIAQSIVATAGRSFVILVAEKQKVEAFFLKLKSKTAPSQLVLH